MHAVCVAQPAQTTCKRTASWAVRNLLGRFSMIVAHLIASFQAMDDDFATRATYSRSGYQHTPSSLLGRQKSKILVKPLAHDLLDILLIN